MWHDISAMFHFVCVQSVLYFFNHVYFVHFEFIGTNYFIHMVATMAWADVINTYNS